MRNPVKAPWVPFVLLLAVCLAPSAAADDDAFPSYDSIQPNVDFWMRVWGEWGLGQVAVHDRRFPGAVFAVVDLPGTIETKLSPEQRDFMDDLTEAWADRMKTLERKVLDGLPLSDDEKSWALALTEQGGQNALHDAHEYVRTQRGLRERFLRGIEISQRYEAKIREIFRGYGLPEDLAYLPHVESSFQYGARSKAGAVGAWQFTRGTGRLYMPITSAYDARLDVLAAADAAARYLRDSYAKLGSWPIALTSYNHGVAGMQRAMEKHGDYESIFLHYDGRRFGFASKNFYAEFLAARALAREADTYFPEGYAPEPLHDLDATELESRTTPARLAGAFDVDLDALVAINPGWTKRAIRDGLALPQGITVWLPRGTHERLAAKGHVPDYTLAGWIDSGGDYVVQPGDTLSVIAASYGISVARLRELNGMGRGESLIRVGQRLHLSGEGATAVHVVRSGDSLSTIARRYRMPVSTLRTLNGMAPNEHVIRVGQSLRVAGEFQRAGSRIHVVRRGDTLGRIAGAYGVRLSELLDHNGLSERSVIRPGQKILIPS